MKLLDAAESHIYIGLGLLAGGVGGATNSIGIGLAVFGAGLIAAGVLRAFGANPEAPVVAPRKATDLGLRTASPEEE